LRAKLSDLYVSGWYLIGGLIFTLLAYPVGNLVPELLPGAQGAAFSGLWIHDAIGLYVTPLALAIAYWVIPVATRRPIYSHFLSMLGFWGLFFVYPLNGTHHYVFSAIPMEAQYAAVTASVILGLDVILVVTNLLMSLKGSAQIIKSNMPLRFVREGILFYLLVSLQGSAQALLPFNKLVHFSDWVIGHSHLAMLGFASFITIGGLGHVWQSLPGAKYNAKAMSLCYWLLLAGLILMVGDLTLAGLVEANTWQSGLPWLESVRAVKNYWLTRTISGLPIILGFISLVFAFFTGEPNEHAVPVEQAKPSFEAQGAKKETSKSGADSLLNMAYLSASIAGIVFFIVSFGLLAILPGLAIEKEIKRTQPKTMLALSPSEERGRHIYARDGCAYCHTQQIRVVPNDVQRFGAPTRAWETIYEYPQLWGTRRIGPDLARESQVRTDDWQLTHLYNPRLVVKDSVMPPFPWLFNGSASKPSQEAIDLLAYLKSLGRERQLAGYKPVFQTVPSYCECSDDVKKLETAPIAICTNATMARQNRMKVLLPMPPDASERGELAKKGALLFSQNCASCHGTGGRGDGAAAETLMPVPANLTIKHLSDERLSFVLLNGVYGSAMPAWRDMPQKDLQSLVAYVSGLGSSPSAVTTQSTEAKLLYLKNCATCHGTTGSGNGPAAGALAPLPTNFQQICPSTARALQVINDGVPGTSMPPWKDQLTLAERGMLASYVTSLYSAAESETKEKP
jgi:cbb3-type cytochrome oxidase cytochrome c subunit/mono/diheme cytochrome c family protein